MISHDGRSLFCYDMEASYTISEESQVKFSIELPVQFRDIDVMGHVNNATYLQYMETARVELARRLGKLTEETKPSPFLEWRSFQDPYFLELVGKQCCESLRRVQRYLVRSQRPAHWICTSRQLARIWHITTHWRKNRRQNRETCQDHHSLQYSDRCTLAWQRILSEPDFPGRVLHDHYIVYWALHSWMDVHSWRGVGGYGQGYLPGRFCKDSQYRRAPRSRTDHGANRVVSVVYDAVSSLGRLLHPLSLRPQRREGADGRTEDFVEQFPNDQWFGKILPCERILRGLLGLRLAIVHNYDGQDRPDGSVPV